MHKGFADLSLTSWVRRLKSTTVGNVANKHGFVQPRGPAAPVPSARASRAAAPSRPARSVPLALLLAPPVYDFALYDLFLKPYALCRLGAWLQTAGYRVRLVNALDYTDPQSLRLLGPVRRDSRGTGKLFRQVVATPSALGAVPRRYARYGIVADSLAQRLAGPRPELVLVSAGMTYWYPGVVEAIRLVRRLHPGVPVVLGGIYPSLCPAHARRVSEADHVVGGDADTGLPAILSGLGLPLPPGPPVQEPALLPEANWQAGILRINRGCPLECAYCASRRIHPRFAPGDYRRVLETTLELYRRFGTQSFAFYDDALLARKEAGLVPFLEAVIRAQVNLEFYVPNGLHMRYLDLPTAALMRRAGFREIRLGYESDSPGFHETLDRKFDPQQAGEAIEMLRLAGFEARQILAYVLAGLPGQHRQEVEHSIRSAAALGVGVQVAEFSPVPGSALWDSCVRASALALEEEPLTHNNSLLPLEWEGLKRSDLEQLKRLARELSAPAGGVGGGPGADASALRGYPSSE